jgi:hypothetical protein
MSKLLERLLNWIADVLDRSLIAVPELDDEWPTPFGRPWPGQAGPVGPQPINTSGSTGRTPAHRLKGDP